MIEGPIKERIRYLINRYNYDIFRVSFDFLLISIAYFLFKSYLPLSGYSWFVFGIFILLWAYQLYYHIFESIYQLEPTFHSDSLMLKTGFQLFFKGFGWVNFLISLGILALLIAIFFLIQAMLNAAQVAQWTLISSILSTVFLLLGLYSLVTYKYKSFGKIGFPSQVQSLFRNIRQSNITRRNLAQYDFKALAAHPAYASYDLREKPNIHFLVVESYGRIVYDNPSLFKGYQVYQKSFEERLSAKGWHMASQLSTSPISGGSSWISFTTLLFGLGIRDQGSYLTMLHHPDMQSYPNIMRQLKEKDYKSYRLVAIAGFKGMKIPWDDYKRFYAIDEWINFEDLKYQGQLYGFGPCPPDQYSINFAQEYIRQQGQTPYFLFYITQNSHSPFGSPDKVVDNWQDLNQPFGAPQFSSSIFVQPKLTDYSKAIRYQLDNLTDFISKSGNDNDLFLIIGDHQPPIFPDPTAGWETPIHIISKNPNFIKAFDQYGFEQGLLANLDINPIRHEGVYSMFMKALFEQYGNRATLPEYLPNGLQF